MKRTARGARIPRAAASTLPDELVVWEILARLPAKALLRCRAVCRSWRRLTSGASFLLAHHRRQPSLPLVCFDGLVHDRSDVVDDAVQAFDLRGAPAKPDCRTVLRFSGLRLSRNREFKVQASCDGLLLLSVSNGVFYICNPATRQWRALPGLKGADVAGLYPHNSSGEYRVLHQRGFSSAYRVLTVGFSAEARCIGLPVASPPIEHSSAAAWMINAWERPPVLYRSCLHWVIHRPHEKALIVFDTVAECFRRMCSPAAASCLLSAHLLEMDGKLGFSKIDESNMILKLWVLQDYETEVWSLKCQIKLPIANICFKVMVVSVKGDFLVSSSGSCHLFHCHSNGKLVQNFRWKSLCPRNIGHWFQESLVEHAFFQGQDGGHVVQPPFFQGFL